MEILGQVFLSFFQTSLTACILILAVIIILKIFNSNISIRVKHGLWILVLIRLLVPVVPQMNINLNISNIINTFEQNYEKNILEQDTSESISKDTKIQMKREKNNYQKSGQVKNNYENQQIEKQDLRYLIFNMICVIWISGVVVMIATFTVSLLRFKNIVKAVKITTNKKFDDLMSNLMKKINLKSKIPIYVSKNVRSPLILGIFNPKIYIPEYVLHLDCEMLSHILLHELMHYKRKDLFYNFLAGVSLSLHWFNPLVWFAVNKMKLYREYACDSCVLENLGEEENVNYGMTIINLSKIFFDKKNYLQLGLCFESNNQIKGRIEMIKGFRNGSYRISAKAALGCLIATTVVLTNGITVNALDVNTSLTDTNISKLNFNEKHEFLIDSDLKAYSDIKKVKEITGFDFKLPDYILESNAPASYQVIKVSDTSNAVQIFFYSTDTEIYSTDTARKKDFSLKIFKDDPVEALKKIDEVHNRGVSENGDKVESDIKELKIGGIQGKNITLTITTPKQKMSGYEFPETQKIEKNFVWEHDGVFYGICYSNVFMMGGNSSQLNDISQDELEKISSSLKELDEIKNVDYITDLYEGEELSTEAGLMSIYDKDDLKEAEKILGFNPKMPLKINENVIITNAGVGITGDSDVENKKINYELNSFYDYGQGKSIIFNQSNHDSFNTYYNIKTKGYYSMNNEDGSTSKKVQAEKMDVDGKTVFKYIEKFDEDEEVAVSADVVYTWEENGIYYSITLFNEDQYQDEIAKGFINSQPIK